MGQPVVLVRDDGYARAALVQRVESTPGAQQPVLDCVVVNDQGVVESHRQIPHSADAPTHTTVWRRQTDHPTNGEFDRESAR